MSKEIWLPVIGFEKRYKVSNLGRIKSLDSYILKKSSVTYFVKGRTLKQFKTPKGYMAVKLCFNGIEKTKLAHRVVAEAFIDNAENKPQVNHINGIKDDNRVDNLEWCTNDENVKHKVLNGLTNCIRGEAHYNAKLNYNLVEEIRYRLSNGESGKSICKDYNVSDTTIYNIKKGKIWNTQSKVN